MKLRRGRRLAALLALAALAGGCTRLTLAWADLSGDGPAASPPVLEQGVSLAAWKDARPALQEAFERHVYGAMPEQSSTRIISRRIIDDAAFGGRAALEELTLVAAATFNGVTRESAPFRVNIAIPHGGAPAPLIVMQSFCPRTSAMPHPGVTALADGDFCAGDGVMAGLMRFVFGRYIATPPVETVLDRGYALAALYPGEAIPDAPEEGLAALRQLSSGHDDDETRWGAIAAWGWLYSRTLDALQDDARLDPEAQIAWGHSRYGKAALVAAAFDPRIDAVISHQSGTGGASLNRAKKGESIRAITQEYPHWFARSYAAYADGYDAPIDQHHLLALIAPRPLFLGNARRDVWSDPNGAFRAAKGADAAYELYGAEGLRQARLDRFYPQADIAFWMRPGTHGVVEEDWPAFLEFLDAHFKAGPPAAIADGSPK